MKTNKKLERNSIVWRYFDAQEAEYELLQNAYINLMHSISGAPSQYLLEKRQELREIRKIKASEKCELSYEKVQAAKRLAESYDRAENQWCFYKNVIFAQEMYDFYSDYQPDVMAGVERVLRADKWKITHNDKQSSEFTIAKKVKEAQQAQKVRFEKFDMSKKANRDSLSQRSERDLELAHEDMLKFFNTANEKLAA